jgi:hypothetical protein
MALGTTGMLAVTAVVAGTVGAGTAALVAGTCRSDSASPAAPAAEVAALEERLGKQEKEIAALRARLEEAVHAQTVAAGTGDGAGSAGLHGKEFLEVPSGTVIGTHEVPPAADVASMTPEERAKYESVYKSMRTKEREDAQRARVAAQENALRTRLDRMPENLALTDAQKDTVVRVLSERGEKVREAYEEARTSGGGVEAYRAAQEKVAAIRQEAHDTLAQSLTVDQVKAVEQLSDRGGTAVRGGSLGNRGTGVGGGGGRRNAGGGTGNAGSTGGGETQPPK